MSCHFFCKDIFNGNFFFFLSKILIQSYLPSVRYKVAAQHRQETIDNLVKKEVISHHANCSQE